MTIPLTVDPSKNMRPASSGGTMFLALLVGRGRLFRFRPPGSAVVNDELSPAVPIFRVRATSFWTMWLLWRWAGLAPLAYHATSLLLHIANTWLLYGVCMA